MIWKRTLLVVLLTVTGLALETSLFGEITLNGTKPELLMVVTVAVAMREGPGLGSIVGFLGGLMTDLTLDAPAGMTALTWTLVGYVAGSVRAQMRAPSAWTPIAMVATATVAADLFYAAFSAMLAQATPTLLRVLRNAGQAAAYNALLTPFVYPVVRVLGARLRPRSAEVLQR